MSLGDVIFNAKLNTQPLEREVKKVERMKVKSPFSKFKEDFTFFTAGMKASAEQMKMAQKEALGYEKVYEDLVEQGKAFKASMDSMIGGPTLSQQEDFQKLSQKIQQAKSDMEEAFDYMKHAERGFNAKNLFGKAVAGLKNFGSKILHANRLFKGLGKSARDAGGSISHGMGMGIKRMLGLIGAGSLVYKTFQYVREGMNNLIAYDSNTANSVNTLRGALMGLKNALASAFAPILNVVAPILAKFIGMLTAAANAVASFISALTGRKFAIVASGVAGGLDGIGGSASGANDSAKELQRTLMGFDKINKLDSDSGGGSGGGGGGGGAGGGGGFDLVPVSDEVNAWADKVKESWEKADFYWLGELLANKINDALAKIDWDKINATLEKIAKSIGTFLNGFIENLDWSLLGKTVGEGIKSAMNFVSTFLETVNWEAIGKAVVDFLTGIDWVGVFNEGARLLGNIANAVFGVLKGAINEAHSKLKSWIESGKIWDDLFEIGKKAVEVTVNLIKGAWGLLNDLVGLMADVAISLIKSGWKKFTDLIFGDGESEGLAQVGIELIKKGWSTFKKWLFGDNDSNVEVGVTGNVDKVSLDPKVDRTFGGFTASFTKKINNIKKKKQKTFGGFTASFVAKQNNIKGKNKIFGGYTASFTSKIDSIPSSQKTISGFTAKVTRVAGGKGIHVQGGSIMMEGGGVYKNGKWSPIQRYDTGGLPKGSELFWARESGPELVGKLGGHTAVMNNDQIVASVSSGVAKAIAGIRFKMSAPKLADVSSSTQTVDKTQEIIEASNQQMVMLLTQILKAINSQETNVYLDGEQIKNNVVRRINNHTRSTGQLELII